ncbi:MAG: cell wall binding repeat 2-containing protein [Cyanobacteria bacterium RYN_339]|nr:cell wall binding repeat 2-containing protein [Cyanobacteria bacterium RYN_339]
MNATTFRVLSAACLTASLAGCAIAGAGAGILGVPTQTQGSPANGSPNPSASGSQGPSNQVNASKPVDRVDVSTNNLVIQAGKTQKVTGTVKYLDGSQDSDLKWASNDGTVVTINETTGEIAGVKEGNATIYARAAANPNIKSAIINVSVKPGIVVDLSVTVEPSEATIKVNSSQQLDGFVTNSSGKSHANGNWRSSDEGVAFVNDQGVVRGLKEGKATITFTSDQAPSVKGTSQVTVTK